MRVVWRVVLRGAAVACLALASSACGLFDAPPPLPTAVPANVNILVNAGFEAGPEPWVASSGADFQSAPVVISDVAPHGGKHALELKLAGGGAEGDTQAGVVTQATNPHEFPEFVSGFYRVDDWQPRAQFRYLYVSVTVAGGDFPGGARFHELRILVGAPTEPPLLPNLTFAFLRRDPPVLHHWTYFGFPLKTTFQSHFAYLPPHWDAIYITVGVRSDLSDASRTSGSADVVFDDLYAGTQADNPNRPPDP